MAKGENKAIIAKYKEFERTRQVPRSTQRKRDRLENLANKLLEEDNKKNEK